MYHAPSPGPCKSPMPAFCLHTLSRRPGGRSTWVRAQSTDDCGRGLVTAPQYRRHRPRAPRGTCTLLRSRCTGKKGNMQLQSGARGAPRRERGDGTGICIHSEWRMQQRRRRQPLNHKKRDSNIDDAAAAAAQCCFEQVERPLHVGVARPARHARVWVGLDVAQRLPHLRVTSRMCCAGLRQSSVHGTPCKRAAAPLRGVRRNSAGASPPSARHRPHLGRPQQLRQLSI